MKRRNKIVFGSAIALVSVLALAFALVASFDWNRAKPWLNDKVSQATQRSFAINGDLSVNWRRPLNQSGWRSWLPWPHLRAKNVTLGNPQWATTGPTMANVQQVDFTLNLLDLPFRTISVSQLLLTEPRLNLERDRKLHNNWTFPRKEDNPKSGWQFVVLDLSVIRGNVRLVDPDKGADIDARIDTRSDGTVFWTLNGVFNDEKLTGSGKAGSLMSLQERGVKYPVAAVVKVGDTMITANGTLTDPAHLSALDVELKILGASMADLFPLSGVLLPETPKFSTQGRVVGTLARDKMDLRYERFTGKVGTSDIGGTLEYIQRHPRPLLRGEVTSNLLNLKDLGPLIGVGDDPKKQKRGEIKQPPDRVLPVSPFKTERWGTMDVDVTFAGKKIVRSEALPIDNLHTNIRMNNGVLSLAPLNFGVAGGNLTAELTIDGRNNPAKAQMKTTARGLKLKELFPAAESMRGSLGEVVADAKLSAAGNSVAALLATSNGEVKALMSEGTISKFILEAAGLNLGSVLVTKLFGDRQVQINCMAVDFDVTQGLMQPRYFVVDTTDATIGVSGRVNLASEELNLTIHPDSKGARIISLRSPLYVKGTFKHPQAGVDKGVVALKAGAAIALGVAAAPLAGLAALINPGPGKESPCATLLVEAGKKPVAPPPGKTASGAKSK
jgi:uncharacterized protein involved in outer membrane biogenesis